MRRLYLLRHAKSDWNSGAGSDHDRPLAPRGVAAAQSVGRFLSALGQQPEAIFASSAVRALSTAELAAQAGNWTGSIQTVESLYSGSVESLLVAARGADDRFERILLVGHEPVWSMAVAQLTGALRVKMVTAALARVDFAASRWSEVGPGTGTLCWLVTPKLLDAASR